MKINKVNEDQYLTERVEDQINWYSSKSKSNQKRFKIARFIEIICAAIIPFIAGMSASIPLSSVIIGVLGITIAVSAGFSVISKHQENWIMYRTTCETLKHEKFLFLTATKPYHNQDSFNQFVERIENLISKENTQWSKVSREKTNDKQGA